MLPVELVGVFDNAGNLVSLAPKTGKPGPKIFKPALLTTSPSGGVAINGLAFPNPFTPQEIDIHNARIAEPLLTLSLPSPYYPGQPKDHAYGTPVYHPSGWNGYKFWMVGAPFPGSNAAYENPCIYVSNDGENFSVPAGLTNPIFGPPAVGNYSDPQICFSPDYSKLYVIWVWENGGGTIPGGYSYALMISESTDGVTWATPQVINGQANAANRSDSPSLFWNGNGWTVLYVQAGQAGTPLGKITTSSTTPYTGWGAVTAPTMTHPLSRNWWHCYFSRAADGQVIGMVQDNNNDGGQLYTCSSADGGNTFTVRPFTAIPAAAGGNWYRPSLCICSDGVKQEIIGYFSRIGGLGITNFQVQKAKLAFDAHLHFAAKASVLDMVNRQVSPGRGITVWDSFTRANAAVLGNADSGQAWTTQTGTFGILSNTANNQTTNNNIATIDPGFSNCSVEVALVTIGSAFNLICNFQDSGNFWQFGWNGAQMQLQKIVAGGAAYTFTFTGFTPSVGDILGLVRKGQFLAVYYNGRLIDMIQDAAFANSTLVGLQASGATATQFDNFIAGQA